MTVADDDPRMAAAQLIASHEQEWVERLVAELTRRLSGRVLDHVMHLWCLSATEMGDAFGASADDVEKWVTEGPPPGHARQIADLQAISELLERHLKRDRIPDVVRRRAPGLSDESLVSMIFEGRGSEALALTRRMFAFDSGPI